MGKRYAAKKNHSGSIYVIYRKIRFLKRRGTLFRKMPRDKPVIIIKSHRKTGNGRIYHLYRILRYLIRTGKLFRKKHTEKPGPDQRDSKRDVRFSVYRGYRILRFLIHTGKIFERKQKTKKGRPRNNLKIVYRKFRYLSHRGKLWSSFNIGIRKFFRYKFAFLVSRKYIIILLNSTALFLLAYLLVFLFTQVSMAIAALTFNIETVIYYYDIDFLIRGSEWVPDAVKVIYTTGPFVSLVLAILSIIIYVNIATETWAFRLFLLWVFCHSFMHFFGEFLMGTLLGKGFGYVVMYLFFLDTPKMVLTFLDFVIILFSGLAFARLFLLSANIYLNKLDKSNRMPFALSQLFLPFLLGTGIIVLIKLPKISVLEICVDFSMLILLLPVVFRARVSRDLFFDEEKKRIQPFWILILITVIFAVLFRILFGIGIRL